ncbi:hypothetical protein AMATHDRAFT_146422 [Amanita thiersii Skay4041]|uniref:Mitochondrial K+-H+ exchange-related-domain-containing protein n=1 Tax=Amanita thiersii Skay4041 TaxID=703135 RepID=A0A2A9NG47_9AGAR|nr:hypothetical protein AMATHDRAFT_146422 [Amanita thiersii Skay4041]
MRRLSIIAIPLTRPLAHARSKRILTYYQFQISHPPLAIPPFSTTLQQQQQEKGGWQSGGRGEGRKGASGGGLFARWMPEGGVVRWASAKAAETWAGFGKQEKGWKVCRSLYQTGERLVDRMDFEELALKSIDPSLGPRVTVATGSGKRVRGEGGEEKGTRGQIPLVYPPSISSGSETLRELRALVSYRLPKHRKGFYLWMMVAPFTAPFMIVPVIPNIPFFFCVWRSWSHYRAYKASQYIDTLLEHGSIIPEESPTLDAVYRDAQHHAPQKGQQLQEDEGDHQSHQRQHAVLLTREAVPSIVGLFSLKKSAEADVYRAVEQARLRVESGRTEL